MHNRTAVLAFLLLSAGCGEPAGRFEVRPFGDGFVWHRLPQARSYAVLVFGSQAAAPVWIWEGPDTIARVGEWSLLEPEVRQRLGRTHPIELPLGGSYAAIAFNQDGTPIALHARTRLRTRINTATLLPLRISVDCQRIRERLSDAAAASANIAFPASFVRDLAADIRLADLVGMADSCDVVQRARVLMNDVVMERLHFNHQHGSNILETLRTFRDLEVIEQHVTPELWQSYLRAAIERSALIEHERSQLLPLLGLPTR